MNKKLPRNCHVNLMTRSVNSSAGFGEILVNLHSYKKPCIPNGGLNTRSRDKKQTKGKQRVVRIIRRV